MADATQSNARHKPRKDGLAQTTKKASERFQTTGQQSGKHKTRAFGVANLGRSKRSVQRNADRSHRKEVSAAVRRDSGVAPTVIVVVGPRGSGKTTLIKSLVKLHTRHSLKTCEGPITIISGKDKRITLIECPDDACALIDLCKVADLVLLTVDASFGFEMVTFEALACLQAHGFPKVVGVLTHLDKMKTNKSLQMVKKALKHRFWQDVYDGAKMFYIGGILQSGKYPRNEMRQLALYVNRVKYRPLSWRNAHGYVVVDRVDDATPGSRLRADEDCSRRADCYGYVRGARLKPGGSVHVPGLGDFAPSSIEVLDDPLPLISKTSTLEKSDSVIYAPLADVGGVAYDDDAVYIDLKTVAYSKEEDLDGEGRTAVTGGAADLVRRLQASGDVDDKLQASELQLFGGSSGVSGKGVQAESSDSDSASDSDSSDDDASSDDDDEESGEEEVEDVARASFFEDSRLSLEKRRAAREAGDLGARVYEREESEEEEEEEDGDLFRKRGEHPAYKARAAAVAGLDESDDDVVVVAFADDDEDLLEGARSCFAVNEDKDEYGDFEALDESDDGSEEDTPAEPEQEETRDSIAASKARAMAQRTEEDEEDKEDDFAAEARKVMRERVAKTDEVFADEAERTALEGHRAGLYVRIRLEDVPKAFFEGRDAARPVILGGLLPHETTAPALLTARVRRHRWHGKILKARDPVVFSCGWRRFQSAPIYSLEDERQTRVRFLKYTPEHMHCGAHFKGFGVAPNTPILGFHSLKGDCATFRVCLVGVIISQDTLSPVVKKLKLCGAPYRVEKNTAFIDGMFTSALEAAKFEGAQIKTVSGIRGSIKKAIREDASQTAKNKGAPSGKAGAFRATFEDKLLLGDVVVCRLWVPVEPPPLCLPVGNLLEGVSGDTLLARSVAEMRRATQTPIPVTKDSLYKGPIERAPRKFSTQKLPRRLVESLPFASRPKEDAPKSKKKDGYLQQREDASSGLKPRESTESRRTRKLVHQLETVRAEKRRIKGAAKVTKKRERAKVHAKIDASRAASSKAKNKEAHKRKGKSEGAKRAKFSGGDD